MWRDLHASHFGQSGDLPCFGQASDIWRWQVENRCGTLVDQSGEIIEALQVFSRCNGDRGGRSDFGHFIHAAGGWHWLLHPEKIKWFKSFAGGNGPFGTALTVATVDQVQFVTCSFAQPTENIFIESHVLFRWHFSTSRVDLVLPRFSVTDLFENHKRIGLRRCSGLFGQFSPQRAPGIRAG